MGAKPRGAPDAESSSALTPPTQIKPKRTETKKTLTRKPIIGQNLFHLVALGCQCRTIIGKPPGTDGKHYYRSNHQVTKLNKATRSVKIAKLAPSPHKK